MNTITNNHIQSIIERTERASAAKARRDKRIQAVREGAGLTVAGVTERAHAAQQVMLEDELGRHGGLTVEQFFALSEDEQVEVLHTEVEILTDPFVLAGGIEDDGVEAVIFDGEELV